MRERSGARLLLIALCLFFVMLGGCLDLAGVQTVPPGSPDFPGTVSLLPTTPAPLNTPNSSNSQEPSGTYPPHHPPYIFIFTLRDAINLSEPISIPMKLPEGYSYGGGSTDTAGAVSLHISNSSDSIHYRQVSPRRPVPGTLSGPTSSVSSNGITGICTTNGSQYQFSWSDGTNDYYLSGTLSCEEFLPMAGSLELLTPETLEKVPWKELQPATPLPPAEILNLVFSREWLDAHDTNPDPRIINVTMTAAGFNSSFSPDQEDPGLLRQAAVDDDRPVAFLTMPKTMFARFNDDPSLVKINFPDTFFRFSASMDALRSDLERRRAGSPSPGMTPEPETPIRTMPSVPPTTQRIS